MTNSRVLREVHETAQSLHRSGAIDERAMREFDVLALPQVRELSAKQIRALRVRTGMSQAGFAAFLNTSVSVVQKWENGETTPSGPALKLLNAIEQKGIEAVV
jgi:putative transcriptional regulator